MIIEECLYEPTPLEAARLKGMVYVVVAREYGAPARHQIFHGCFETREAAERHAEQLEAKDDPECRYYLWKVLEVVVQS